MSIYHILLVFSFLGCIFILAVVNHAAVNMGAQVSLQDLAFSVYPQVELLDHVVILFWPFWGTAILFSAAAVLYFTFPPIVHEGSNLSTFSPRFVFSIVAILTGVCAFDFQSVALTHMYLFWVLMFRGYSAILFCFLFLMLISCHPPTFAESTEFLFHFIPLKTWKL